MLIARERCGSRFEGGPFFVALFRDPGRVRDRGLPVPVWPVPKQSGRNDFAVISMERLWQHRACYAATAGPGLNARSGVAVAGRRGQ